MNMTRRDFIGSLFSIASFSLIGFLVPKKNAVEKEDWFEDLIVDRYYMVQGGPYKDTGGWGCPYDSMGNELVQIFRYFEQCNELEDKFEKIEENGFYLSPSQYFGKPYCRYEKIPMTKKWLMEFYRRHKNDTAADWQKRYDDYYDSLRASGWKASDDDIMKG